MPNLRSVRTRRRLPGIILLPTTWKNHGGRVLDYGQGVAEVLPAIARGFKKRITIMADGAVRTGFDVLKLLALGADVALIGRPLARMSNPYLDHVKKNLRMATTMTGCDSLEEIAKNVLVKDTLLK
jgi:4-hydroxymandelate oxidase